MSSAPVPTPVPAPRPAHAAPVPAPQPGTAAARVQPQAAAPVPASAASPAPRPVGTASGGASVSGGLPPLTLDRFGKITDFYLFDNDDPRDFAMAAAFADCDYARPVIGTEIEQRVRDLLQTIRSHPNHKYNDFQVVFEPEGEDGPSFVYRVHRDDTVHQPQLALRLIPPEVPRLSDLTLPPFWKDLLLSEALLEGGLVILSAKPGQGKSTTIAGMIRERLEKFGGVARSIEAPPEFPGQNSWGDKGVWYQIPVDESLPREEMFSRPIRAQMRAYPTGVRSILMVGEIRDKETAAEVVNASVGHLVISTIHALDIESAIRRLCGWSGQVFGSEVAREMVASSLRMVLQQNLIRVPDGKGGTKRVAEGEMLFSRGAFSDVGSIIREGNFSQLLGKITEQGRKIAAAATQRKNVEAFLDELSQNLRKQGQERV